MSVLSYPVYITWLDKLGRTVKTVYYFASALSGPLDSLVTGLVAAIELISNLKPLHIAVGGTDSHSATPGTGAYACEDKAALTIADQDGKAHTFQVPALKAAILLPDKERIDPANGAVTAWITEMKAHASGEGAATLTTYVKGLRRQRKPLKGAAS